MEGMRPSFAHLVRQLVPRRRPTVAVEIGTDALKILQLPAGAGRGRRAAQGPRLTVVRLADLKQPLAEELPPLFASLGIHNQPVTTYLPRKLVTMRFIEVPTTDDRELAEMMRLQGIKQTPYASDEVSMAYTVVGSRQEGMSDVVLTFCQRKFVDERVDLLRHSGLLVRRVGVSTEGVVDWYVGRHPPAGGMAPGEIVVLLDQDLSSSDLIFCRAGQFVYSKGIQVGANQLAADPNQGIERYCRDVKRAIDFTMGEAPLLSPKKIVLIAPLEGEAPLRKALEETVGVPVEVCNPLLDGDLSGEAAASGVSIAPLLGFGRERNDFLFELMPEDLKLSLALERRNRQMITTAILALGLLAAIGLSITGTLYKRKAYLELLTQEIAKTQEYASSIEGMVVRTRLIEKVKDPEGSVLTYLKKVAGVLTPGVYFSSIDYKVDQLVLKGNAAQMSDVFAFAKALEELQTFQEVKSERVSKKKEGDQTVAEFEIKCLLH